MLTFKMSSSGSDDAACRQYVCATGHAMPNNTVFHSNAHTNQTLLQLIHILHFCLVLIADSTRLQLIGLRSWLFGNHKSGVTNTMSVGFIQLLRTVSLQTKIAVYTITAREDWKKPISLDIWCMAGLRLSVGSSTVLDTFSSVCALRPATAIGRYFRVSHSLLSTV